MVRPEEIRALRVAVLDAGVAWFDRPPYFGQAAVAGEPDMAYQVEFDGEEYLGIVVSLGNVYRGPLPPALLEAGGFRFVRYLDAVRWPERVPVTFSVFVRK